jgi:hypothetical protein
MFCPGEGWGGVDILEVGDNWQAGGVVEERSIQSGKAEAGVKAANDIRATSG